VYDLATVLLRPFVLADVVILAALVGIWRCQGSRRRLAVLSAAFAVLLVMSLPLTGRLAVGSLEWQYPPLEGRPADATAIVVLSGSLRPTGKDGSRFQPGVDTLYRCLLAAELYRESPCLVLASGGRVHPEDPGPPVASAMADFLLTQGVRHEDILLEKVSRTTYENAVESSKLLGEKGIRRVVLVTDAVHLPRAVGCFRKQGMDVVPCGCRYRTLQRKIGVRDFLPEPSAAAGVEEAAHEWLGHLWYRMTGKL
jgi:uncharacterized SAM-binding protein YcdF (DUF218 family)